MSFKTPIEGTWIPASKAPLKEELTFVKDSLYWTVEGRVSVHKWYKVNNQMYISVANIVCAMQFKLTDTLVFNQKPYVRKK